MSDSMTSAQVEDILSSIRRLVSEENRSGAPEESSAAKPVDRLVLTPSLRVEVQNAETDEKSTAETELDLSEPPEHEGEADGLIDDAIATETVSNFVLEDEPGDGFEPPVEDEPPMAFEFRRLGDVRLRDAGFYPAENASASEADGVSTDVEPDEGIKPSDDATDEDKGRPFSVSILKRSESEEEADATGENEAEVSLGEKIAALETLIARRSDQWEPDRADEGEYAGSDAPPLEWQDAEISEADFIQNEAELGPATLEAEEIFEQGDDEAQDLPLDDTSDNKAYSDVPDDLDIGDQSYAEADENVELTDEDEAAFMPEDEALLDEEALREIIADVVRQELQGALGERITRNVRKLVRREIHRALAAQDLE